MTAQTWAYWKFTVDADNVGIGNADFAEVVFSGVNGNTIATAGGTASGAYTSGEVPANAFDGNLGTFWENYVPTGTCDLFFQFPAAETVYQINFYPRQGQSWGLPGTIAIFGSPDGVTYSSLGTLTNIGSDSNFFAFADFVPLAEVLQRGLVVSQLENGTAAVQQRGLVVSQLENGTAQVLQRMLVVSYSLRPVGGPQQSIIT